jgi:hypothetical protein
LLGIILNVNGGRFFPISKNVKLSPSDRSVLRSCEEAAGTNSAGKTVSRTRAAHFKALSIDTLLMAAAADDSTMFG